MESSVQGPHVWLEMALAIWLMEVMREVMKEVMREERVCELFGQSQRSVADEVLEGSMVKDECLALLLVIGCNSRGKRGDEECHLLMAYVWTVTARRTKSWDDMRPQQSSPLGLSSVSQRG